MIADLHVHTKISNGSLGINGILTAAARLKIKYLSITDQDTMGAVSRASVVGGRLGVSIVPGVELSAYDFENEKPVSLLCYLPTYPDRMEGFFHKMADMRNAVFEKQIKLLCSIFPVSAGMVRTHTQGCTTVFTAHIMHTLMSCGYSNEIYGDMYKALFSPGKRCYVPYEYLPYEEVMQLIQSSEGIAILGSPTENGSLKIINKLLELGLDGIEVRHPKNSEKDMQIITKLCDRYDLLTTGGSDFRGMYETPVRPLGTCAVTEAEVEKLYEYKKKKVF